MIKKYIFLGLGCLILAGCEPDRYQRNVYYERPIRDVVVVPQTSYDVSRAYPYRYHQPYHHHHNRVIVRY
ncbi:hypothetical protein [Candidatus Odyssella acanthamoebae]|uniref:hypothetical protein n=1 Tax=Candidatus Odyssella acanthamoebae TaxID=91604 RepID=UPI0012ECA47C|nr:hypothetical protein [Candidatus Paracaedibacter acanthamoebae]